MFSSVFWFCFFKQKTAYEMRISDWSSDVCSSDLALGVTLFSRHQSGYYLTDDGTALVDRAEALEQAGQAFGTAEMNQVAGTVRLDKIGRASCRERVCQYV